MRATSSLGWRCARSISAAFGRTSFLAKSAAVFCTSRCSSVSSQSIDLFALEFYGSLPEEGLHALLLIGGGEQGREQFRLEIEPRRQRQLRRFAHGASRV